MPRDFYGWMDLPWNMVEIPPVTITRLDRKGNVIYARTNARHEP